MTSSSIEPDYSSYTLDELYDAEQHIDRSRFADRYARLVREIRVREGSKKEPSGRNSTQFFREQTETDSARRELASSRFGRRGCAVAVTFILLVVVVLAMNAMRGCRRARVEVLPVIAAIHERYPSEQRLAVHRNTFWISGQTTVSLIITVTDSQVAGKDRRKVGKTMAQIAVRTYVRAEEVSKLVVRFLDTTDRRAEVTTFTFEVDEFKSIE